MTEIDTNYWYNTLSAIPQTLAAMIALAATFSVVKMDQVSKRINDTRIDLRRFILLATSKLESRNEIHEIEQLNDKDFLLLYEKGLESFDAKDNFLGLGQEMFGKYARELSRIIDFEWHSFYSPRPFRIIGYLAMKKDIFKHLLSARNESLSWMMLSLTFAVFNIIISLLVLPNYTYFAGSIRIVYAIVMLSVLNVIVTAWSIWRISKV